ncbi:hypothetical protein BTM505_04060 [Helicobacter pylori]
MNYPNLPNSALEITSQPEVKEITNELLKQLQNALRSNTLFTEQVGLSLKGIVRILEVLLSLDFFKNANEIDSSLRNSIEWLNNAGMSLKAKMKEYESFFNDFNTSMRSNEQEVTATLNANTENIKSEIKKLENQIIETATRLLTSYQIFLTKAKENANNEITTNKTESLEAIEQAKTSTNNEITTNKTASIQAIEQAKTSAKESEIKKRAFKVIEDKEAFLKDLNAIKPMQLPKEIDTDSFLKAFNGIENKENFIKHLKSKPDSKHRLAYLHLVEPTLKEPDITLIFKDQGKVKKEHIKAFQGDPKTIYYFLVTQDNDSKLITGLRTSDNYIKAEIDKADIIHSFIPQDS